MSSPHPKPITFGGPFAPQVNSFTAFDGSLAYHQSADRTIDAALKSVPIPDGLLSRLGLMVSTLPDEVSDLVDYLGC
jgi:hypothetical protein